MRLTRFANILGTVAVLAANANAALVMVTTASRPFDPGVFNQGWWNGTPGFNHTLNPNILTGNNGGLESRSFYTFDLSSPQLAGQQVVSASLQMQRYNIVSDDPTETIGFFDVSTDAATLNNNTGGNADIFADLGTGNSYGLFPISPGDFFEILQFELNSTAVSDINASLGGYFSVGGRWLTITEAYDFGFGGSGDFAVRLALEVQPIPEPSIPALVTLFGAGFVWHRSRRRTSIAFRSEFTRRRLNPTGTD